MKEFNSLEAFAKFFEGAITEATLAARAELEVAAIIVETSSKAKLGTPQPYWAPLSEFTIAYKIQYGFPIPSPLFRTGEHIFGTIERTVTEDEANIGSNDEVAFWQELGTSKIPPRSFLASTLREHEDDIVKMIATSYVRGLSGEI